MSQVEGRGTHYNLSTITKNNYIPWIVMPLEKEDFTFKPIEVDQGSTKQFII
jgi:hypothetical protein